MGRIVSQEVTPDVLVTTPTGNIGRHVATELVAQGVPISVLVREGSQQRLDEAVRQRAEVFAGAMNDPDALTRASVGAKAMFLALPPDPTTDDLAAQWASFTAAAVAAVQTNAIAHVVLISTQGAGPGRGSLMGPLFDTEEALRGVVPNLRALRAGCFMENFLPFVAAIAEGVFPFAVPPTAALSLIATVDIAALAADLLTDLSWTGQDAFGVHGPDDLTPVQIADVLTDTTGHPVRHVQPTPEQVLDTLLGAGMSYGAAKPTADMFTIMGQDTTGADPRVPRGTTPTTFREFATNTLAPAVAAARRG